jgi:dienelactone hydrolase
MSWDTIVLHAVPDVEIIEDHGSMKSILYTGVPYHGKPSRVFAWMGVPDSPGPHPGMVCVHGGGGTAFREWVELWVGRGYAAISMDLGGYADGERLPDGGPDQEHDAKFDLSPGWENAWTYHSIAAVARANTILRGVPSVDETRVGVTGISWGGYLTCIVAGVDHRFACAIPVYGCGFLNDNSAQVWMDTLAEMTPERREEWLRLCDPSSYLGDARMPMLFVSGTNDFAYPLDSLKKSYELPKGSANLCIRPRMPHGHIEGWAPTEIDRYTENLFRDGAALPSVVTPDLDGRDISARFTSATDVNTAMLHFTRDGGNWEERRWEEVPAEIGGKVIRGIVPDGAQVHFLSVEDSDGFFASSAHLEES